MDTNDNQQPFLWSASSRCSAKYTHRALKSGTFAPSCWTTEQKQRRQGQDLEQLPRVLERCGQFKTRIFMREQYVTPKSSPLASIVHCVCLAPPACLYPIQQYYRHVR